MKLSKKTVKSTEKAAKSLGKAAESTEKTAKSSGKILGVFGKAKNAVKVSVKWLVKHPWVIAAIAVAVIIILGIGHGIGKGVGKGNTSVKTEKEKVSNKENQTIEKPETADKESNTIPDEFEGTLLSINVVGNDYFCENERISLQEIVSRVTSIEGNIFVKVKDDNASLRAYNDLIGKLKEEKIRYVEE